MSDEHVFRDPGEPPVLDWIDKSLIDIDPVYQRELDEGRVQRILDWFAWDAFGAVLVAPQEDGRYHCTDGGHRLEAAKRHPRVTVVPAIIIHASGVQAEAENFVAINKDRKNVTQLDLYWAQLAAADPEAVTVKLACADAGVTVQRHPCLSYKPGETIAISAVRAVIDKHGRMRARQILEMLAKASLAPITGLQVRAAELLLTDDEFKGDAEPDSLADAIGANVDEIAAEAKGFAKTHRMPAARAYASVWFRKTRKKRKAA